MNQHVTTTITDAQAAELGERTRTSSDGRVLAWKDMALPHLRNAARKTEDAEMAAYADWREAQVEGDAPPPKNHNLPADEPELPMQITFGLAHDVVGAKGDSVTFARARLNEWLSAHPVVENQEQANEGMRRREQLSVALSDLDKERDGRVRPLNGIVRAINAAYRAAATVAEAVLGTADARLTAFARAEEQRRIVEARAAAERAAELARQAGEAQARAADRLDDADFGEVGVDVASVATEVSEAETAAARAAREAQRAAQAVPVRMPGGFGRAVGLRTKRTLVVEDRLAAVKALAKESALAAIVDKAIVKAARAYEKTKGALPKGVGAREDRGL